jgi:hypothetical protein
MKFLMTFDGESKIPPTPEKLAAIDKYGQEMTQAGVLLMTGGLVKSTKGTKLKLSAGKYTVTDGPYAETKELIDGFALIKASSMEEAMDVARSFMAVAGDGEVEILQVFDAADGPPGAGTPGNPPR